MTSEEHRELVRRRLNLPPAVPPQSAPVMRPSNWPTWPASNEAEPPHGQEPPRTTTRVAAAEDSLPNPPDPSAPALQPERELLTRRLSLPTTPTVSPRAPTPTEERARMAVEGTPRTTRETIEEVKRALRAADEARLDAETAKTPFVPAHLEQPLPKKSRTWGWVVIVAGALLAAAFYMSSGDGRALPQSQDISSRLNAPTTASCVGSVQWADATLPRTERAGQIFGSVASLDVVDYFDPATASTLRSYADEFALMAEQQSAVDVPPALRRANALIVDGFNTTAEGLRQSAVGAASLDADALSTATSTLTESRELIDAAAAAVNASGCA